MKRIKWYDGVIRFKTDETDTSLLHIILNYHLLQDVFTQVNYIYVPRFKRYYFVTRRVILAADAIDFVCRVDVLESFKDDILNTKAFVLRQENKHNYNIIDTDLIYNQKHNISKRSVPANFFNRSYLSGYCVAITVNGG